MVPESRDVILSLVEFRRKTLLPLDDVMGSPTRESIPKLSRSSLHRCLLRHGISRLPASNIKTSARGKFAPTAIGYVHIDIAELRLAEGKLNMFLAIDPRVRQLIAGGVLRLQYKQRLSAGISIFL